MEKIWTEYKGWIILILIIIIGIYGYQKMPKSLFSSQEEFFNNAVKNSYETVYDGIVKRKYYEKDGGRNIIVLEKNGIERKFDYVYENKVLYDFIKIGDTIIKRKNSNKIQIKRSGLDTIISLTFAKIKGSNLYSKDNEYLKN